MRWNKKLIYIGLFLLLYIPYTSAQEKKYGPKKGDWALELSLTPITDIISNMFTENECSSFSITSSTIMVGMDADYSTPSASIGGKYLLTDHWAIRANIGIYSRSVKYDSLKVDAEISPNGRQIGSSISAGMEYRFGEGRVQGFCGGMLNYAAYKYDHDDYKWLHIKYIGQTSIHTYAKESTGNQIAAIGFVGVEYFLLPRLSLSAEMNLLLAYTWKKPQKLKYVCINMGVMVNNFESEQPKSSQFLFGTKNVGGNLSLNIYF